MKINCISEFEKITQDPDSRFILERMFLKSSTDKFKITKHHEGKYPAVITISGFLTEDGENFKKWESSITKIYPDREWFHVEWNCEKVPDKAQKVFNKILEIKATSYFTRGMTAGVLPLSFSPYLSIPLILINNWWHSAVRNSKQAGKKLANTFLACPDKEFILIGHSLGARVIFNCLEHIKRSGEETCIKEVHLLGGAVNSRKAKWNKTESTVKDKVYNYYSGNDSILKICYSAAMIDRYPIGLQSIDLPYFENIDSTMDVFGHTEYTPNFHKLKSKNQKQLTGDLTIGEKLTGKII
ncbi:DUF726 domain-containing protein [Salegentibacter sp. F188]|uniref:DUF726 domain-containing protein n=1 Tax=Autumnicola patrickiae TaxID=3075591 RepID=A0ABU3E6F9_9FLAO|nr:DUF726 domain-containing protein [Salegentibacter sp. F188]MDT0691581.1 DUF726 domain-containing protein [Salegentibacter sp. F188]